MDDKSEHESKMVFRALEVKPPEAFDDPETWRQAVRYQFFYSMAGLILGLACIIGGIVLFLHGVVGSTSWTAKAMGLETNLTDAAPGVILFVVGIFMVWMTRFKVKSGR